MDNISIAENNNLHIQEIPNARVQGDPNVFINSDIVQIGDDITIQIGSTETLPPDSSSYVRNSGDEKHIVLNFGLVRGQNGRDGIDGIDGLNGRDGFSPSATVTQTETGATIAITDVNGTTTANVTNGTDGTDGFSPIANVTGTNYGAEISITDKNGTTTAQVVDGFSPIANVTPTETGATIAITDVNGTTTANIENGVDGTDGTDGTDGVTPDISATASVDGTTGTPSVVVAKSGTIEDPVFHFSFSGLKGVDGQDAVITEVHTTPSSGESYYAWKYPDGKMICFGTRSATLNITQSYEGSYFANMNNNPFADTFIDTPVVVATLFNNNSLLSMNVTGITGSAFNAYVWKTQSKSNVGVQMKYIAFGHWK